jgi:uncharacterized membrane protein
MENPWHLYVMAAFYFAAGINHYLKPHLYTKIMPSFIPEKRYVNEFIGGAEVFLAIFLCITMFTKLAAWTLIPLLILIFPTNIYMLINKDASLGLPKWLLFIRLPIQILLILWAYYYT